MSQNYVSIEKLKSLSNEIKLSWIQDKDKTEEMKELTNILKEINSKSSIEEYFNNSEKEIKYFTNEFIDSIIQNILIQSYVIGKDGDDIALDLLFQIYKLFSTFHKKDYPVLFESIRKIFKNKNCISYFFPQNKINKPEIESNNKKRNTFSQFNKDFCSDFLKSKSEEIFKVGDKVDILVDYNDSRTDIDQTAWVRGIIKKVENGLYYIEYNGEETEITFPIGSHKVQPEGKKTQDWDWRTDLKKYDLVDVYDRDMWWPCTIVDVVEDINKDGIKKVKYKIGFRLYLDHFINPQDPYDTLYEHVSFWQDNNAKADKNNQLYIGDDKEKNEEIYHFSKRIQKFNGYSEIQRQNRDGWNITIIAIINDDIANDNIPEDSSDNGLYLYENNKKRNIIGGKAKDLSYYFAFLLKKMENEGDFEKFIKF